MTAEQIAQLPVGRVLLRDGKTKLRVYRPQHYTSCDLCDNSPEGNMCKWEYHGGRTALALCPVCTVEELK